MDSFKFLCIEAFENLRISACELLLSKIEDAENSISLNLSGTQFSDDTSRALGQALAKDVHIRELDCSNCNFSDESLASILWGLENNKFLLTLNVKGNNIRSHGAQALGKLLRHNNHLENLYLEWNGLGIFPEKFSIFCEGLCTNSSLKSLDLRNNQLNHLCAQSLSDVIIRNSALQKLDLRWNNIGLTGGRSIAKALSRNSTILSLQISGNDIPSELMETIELATSASAMRYINNNEQKARSKYLTNKLQEKEEERNIQVKTLLEQVDKMDKEASINEKWNSKKLAQAEEALAEKDNIIEKFTLKIQELESKNWSLSEEKNGLALSVNALETQNRELMEEYQSTLNKEKKEREKIERELFENLGSLKEENLFLKQQIQELQDSKNQNEKEILRLKNKLDDVSKKQKVMHEEQILSLNEKHDEIMKEADILHQNEISRLRMEFTEMEKILKMKISLLESSKNDLEKELKEKNSKLMLERAQYEERLNSIEKKLKSDHDSIRLQLEERIDMLEDANKEQNEHLHSNLQVLYQLRTDITSLDLEVAEQTHMIEHLKQCLDEKDAEMKAHETKVKLEVKEKLEELKGAKDTIQVLNKKNDALKQNLTELKEKHSEELHVKKEMIKNLEAEIEKFKKKIYDMSEEQRKRTIQLQKAFDVYIKPDRQDLVDSGNSPPEE